jgi:superfamily II DNA or RNA helicase
MFLYLATSAFYRLLYIVKLGMTEDLYGRRSTYQTSCPPGLTPHSHDIGYDAVWETDAQTRDDLFHYEDILHNQYIKWRMMRSIPGDSEWFDFKGHSPLEIVREFMKTMPWVKREVPLSEIAPLKRESRYLKKQHRKNTDFLNSSSKRIEVLTEIQRPFIQAIREFIKDPSQNAGKGIAPCGSGKTLMACKAIKGLCNRVVICCPRNLIQIQWKRALIAEGVFTEDQIHLICSDSGGTTDKEKIRAFMRSHTYCIITTYASSRILVDIISSQIDITINDEAHHLSGVVYDPDDEKGVGDTRRLMQRAVELQIKRLSLTFTQRNMLSEEQKCFSMDDPSIFGPQIAELKLRELIRKGVLPDYRIWAIRDSLNKASGTEGTADCILESWKATEMVRGEKKHILHHLVVFTEDNGESVKMAEILSERLKKEDPADTTLVLCVKGGPNLEGPLRRFAGAKRAIIVNCKVLGEGIDIPIANAVAITYPKYSVCEITQMLLRPGRWYEGKPIFHIIIPVLDDVDFSGFNRVLTTLASSDQQLFDEILASKKSEKKDPTSPPSSHDGISAENIIVEEYEGSNMDAIHKFIRSLGDNAKLKINYKDLSRRVREKSISTEGDYDSVKNEFGWPDDPRTLSGFKSWFDLLHSNGEERPCLSDFKLSRIIPHGITSVEEYAAAIEFPTWNHLLQGYLTDATNPLPSFLEAELFTSRRNGR